MRRIDHDLAKERGAVVGEAIHDSGMTFEAVAAALNYADKSTIHRKIRADGSSFSDTDCDNLAPLTGLRSEYLKGPWDDSPLVSFVPPTEEIPRLMNAYWESVKESAAKDCPTEEILSRRLAYIDSVRENFAKDQRIFELTGYEVARISEVNGCVLYKPGECIKTTEAHLDHIIEAAQSAAQSAVRIKSF